MRHTLKGNMRNLQLRLEENGQGRAHKEGGWYGSPKGGECFKKKGVISGLTNANR